MRALVTGASGFVGANLIEVLQDAGNKVIATSRSRVEQPGIFYIASPELGAEADSASGDSSRLVGVRTGRYRDGTGPKYEAGWRRISLLLQLQLLFRPTGLKSDQHFPCKIDLRSLKYKDN